MATSVADLREWFERGAQDPNNTHMIVVCDTYDWSDYPVYVTVEQNAREEKNALHGTNMRKVMEVYNLKLPAEPQLVGGTRVFNY